MCCFNKKYVAKGYPKKGVRKKDAIIAYKIMYKPRRGKTYRSQFQDVPWIDGKMSANRITFGTLGESRAGIYSYRDSSYLRGDIRYRVVEVKIWGTIWKFRSIYPYAPGYMSSRAEIVEEVKDE